MEVKARRERRGAFTLIEVLVVMAVFSAILGAIMLSLHAMDQTRQRFSDAIHITNQQHRLVVQLRRDAHQASDAKVAQQRPSGRSSPLLELALPGGQQVQYRLFDERIERHLLQEDRIVHRESYAVTPVLQRGWSIDRSGVRPLVAVFVNRPEDGPRRDVQTVPLRVNAVVGRTALPDASVESNTLP